MSNRKIFTRYYLTVLGALAFNFAIWSAVIAQINNPGAILSANQTFSGLNNFTNASGIQITTPGNIGFNILGGPNGSTSLPVPTVYPAANNQTIAFDISPHGGAVDGGYGIAWNDICNTDQIINGGIASNCLHLAARTNAMEIMASKYNPGSGLMPLNLGMRIDNVATTYLQITASGLIAMPAITTDAGKTDATICEDTTNHQLFSGSGTLGICLGTSSLRYKHDVAELTIGLEKILQLRPLAFKMNDGFGDPKKIMFGFSAEDGIDIIPELTGLDIEGKPNTFDYLGIVPVLVKAIQQQQLEIDDLKKRVH